MSGRGKQDVGERTGGVMNWRVQWAVGLWAGGLSTPGLSGLAAWLALPALPAHCQVEKTHLRASRAASGAIEEISVDVERIVSGRIQQSARLTIRQPAIAGF